MNGRLVLSQWYDRRHRANPLIDCQTSQGLGAGADAGPTAVSCHYVLRIKFFFSSLGASIRGRSGPRIYIGPHRV